MDPISFDRMLMSTEVLGLARVFDCLLVMPGNNRVDKFKDEDTETIRIYAHEWSHYFQYVSTNMGHLLLDVYYQLYQAHLRMLVYAALEEGWDYSTPFVHWLRNHQPFNSKSLSVSSIIADDTQKSLRLVFRPLVERIHSGFTCDCDFNLQDNGCLQYNGKEVELSVLQIIEHAAIAGELQCFGNIFRSDFYSPKLLDYYLIFWYLRNKGFISIEPAISRLPYSQNEPQRSCHLITKCSFLSSPLVVPILVFLITQISLNVCEAEFLSTERSSLFEQYNIHAVSSNLVQNMARSAVRTFVRLIKNFDQVSYVAQSSFNKNGSWLHVADTLCKEFGLYSYSKSLKIGIDRIAAYFEHIAPTTKERENNANDIMGVTLRNIMRQGLENLLTFHESSVCPLVEPGNLPFPMVVAYNRKGERRRIGAAFPWSRKVPSFLHVPKKLQSLLMEDERVIEGILYEDCVACYPPFRDRTFACAHMVWPCNEFNTCWNARSKGVTQFCSNSEWQRRVHSTLKSIEELKKKT